MESTDSTTKPEVQEQEPAPDTEQPAADPTSMELD